MEFVSFEKNDYQHFHAKERMEMCATVPTSQAMVKPDVEEELHMTKGLGPLHIVSANEKVVG